MRRSMTGTVVVLVVILVAGSVPATPVDGKLPPFYAQLLSRRMADETAPRFIGYVRGPMSSGNGLAPPDHRDEPACSARIRDSGCGSGGPSHTGVVDVE